MSNKSSQLKTIKIRVNEDEHTIIHQYAADANLSINTFGKKALLNAAHSSQFQADSIMKLIPGLYVLIDQIEDATIRNELKEEVGKICHYLK